VILNTPSGPGRKAVLAGTIAESGKFNFSMEAALKLKSSL
jgi:hypothetical protein